MHDKGGPAMTEEEVRALFYTLWSPGPCSSPWPPAEEAYYENAVRSDLWDSFDFLMNMLCPVDRESWANDEDRRFHVSNYLQAICRLAPEQFFEKAEPWFEHPTSRSVLWFAIWINHLPQSVTWLEPWVDRLDELNFEDITSLIDTFGDIGGEKALSLLHRIRAAVPPEQTEVHKELDLYLKRKE